MRGSTIPGVVDAGVVKTRELSEWIVVGINVHGDAPLMVVRGALGHFGAEFGGGERRQQQGRENRNDGNHDQTVQ